MNPGARAARGDPASGVGRFALCVRFLSDILECVNATRFLIAALLLVLGTLGATAAIQQATPPAPPSGQQQTAPPTTPPAANVPQNPSAQAPAAAPAHLGPVVVLDPAHGGSDDGARGNNGLMEKDLVLRFAQVLKGELEGLGYRVVMTRTDDSDPTYDERDATANMYRNMIYISLHVSTTGTPGTVHSYYYSFWSPIIPAPSPGGNAEAPAAAPAGWIPWVQAQRGYTDASHLLADDLQGELSKQFVGSPPKSTGAEVRELRSVAGPAAAVEVSSVLAPDPATLTNMAAPLAAAIMRGIQDFRPRAPQGGS